MIFDLVFYPILILLSFLIAYHDFRYRLVSVWLLIAFSLSIAITVVFHSGFWMLFYNSIGALCYFLLCFLGVFLVYFIKERQLPKIMDEKIGWADVIVCFAIGMSLNIIDLILFFTGSFILAAIIGLVLQQKNKTVPLAGILVIFYLLFICILKFFPIDLMNLIG